MLFDERRVKNWLELFGLGEAYQIHASGHASGSEITKMISQINPKIIYPVHTESNALFVQRFKQAKTIEKGVQYTI